MTDWRVVEADCVEAMRELDADSIDAVVCDPPYGLEFMGKEWDRLGATVEPTRVSAGGGTPAGRADGLPNGYAGARVRYGGTARDMQEWHYGWAVEALRVLKPGGHLLAFGGTRTYHRLACALEDAGFEIRDCLIWMYGSGFPKSHDVAKAIDRHQGVDVQADERWRPTPHFATGAMRTASGDSWLGQATAGERVLYEPSTSEAEAWQGWGTALKPAFEPVIMAQKPVRLGDLLGMIGSHLERLEDVWRAQEPGPTTRTGAAEGSPEATATSPSASPDATSWNIVSSWRDCWAATCDLMSMSTTETASATITDMRILCSCLAAITPENITQAAMSEPGRPSPVSAADDLFAAVATRLRGILALSATASAIAREPISHPDEAAKPEWRPIVMARKPVAGTVAANVLEHGTGGMNIDATRIGTAGRPLIESEAEASVSTFGDGLNGSRAAGTTSAGRWPANVLLAHADDCVRVGTTSLHRNLIESSGRHGDSVNTYGDGRNGSRSVGEVEERVERWACVPGCPVRALDEQTKDLAKAWSSPAAAGYEASSYYIPKPEGYQPSQFGDQGGASRFFYTAKASGTERNAGLGDLPERDVHRYGAGVGAEGRGESGGAVDRNHHPTVKPVDLMRWLVRLVTPKGGTVLDPFAGSGTTGIAARLERFAFVGVERDPDYADIARRRIDYWDRHRDDALERVRRVERGERDRDARREAGQLDLFGAA